MNELIQMIGCVPIDASSRQGRMTVRACELRCLETAWRLPGRTAAPEDGPQGGTVAPASIAGLFPIRRRRPICTHVRDIFSFLIPAALLAVTLTLGYGLYALFRGGDFGRSRSNKLMRLRVALQFLAVIILVAAFWYRTR
jgi:hypothetical protein